MSFNTFLTFKDLPRATSDSQKKYLREGGEINLETAIALYRNRKRLYGSIRSNLLPSLWILCRPDFLKDMWEDMRYDQTASHLIFGKEQISVMMTLLEAGKFFLYTNTLLIYATKHLDFSKKDSLLMKLNQSLKHLHTLQNQSENYDSLKKLRDLFETEGFRMTDETRKAILNGRGHPGHGS